MPGRHKRRRDGMSRSYFLSLSASCPPRLRSVDGKEESGELWGQESSLIFTKRIDKRWIKTDRRGLGETRTSTQKEEENSRRYLKADPGSTKLEVGNSQLAGRNSIFDAVGGSACEQKLIMLL